jgi:diguanylate cyclase (GGDEF)-like protein
VIGSPLPRSGSLQRRSLALALVALAAALAIMSTSIVLSRGQSKSQIVSNLKARGMSSAGFLSAFIGQQAARERESAERYLATPTPDSSAFRLLTSSLGSRAAVLLDRSGRLLDVVPSDRTLLGSDIALRYAHLAAAETGRVAVSGVVGSAASGTPVVAIAAPYPTKQGRRVISVAYPVAGGVLSLFVDHTSTLPSHQVLLVDAAGNIIASSPHTRASTLRQANGALASATLRAGSGAVRIDGASGTFVTAAVGGTPWRLIIAAPNSRLFASISGSAKWLPWIVVALVALLGLAVVGLLLRSQMERARLAALSKELAQAASTDTLTGLANRRWLQAQLAHASAYANRYDEALSVLMIDLDRFKLVNDNHGHEAGDRVLMAVADTMRHVFRDSDIFGRWGGDEFVAVLPSTESAGAFEAGQRLCASVAQIDVTRYGLTEPITLSVGCASAVNAAPNDLINEADDSLYRAKRDGRSRVSVS